MLGVIIGIILLIILIGLVVLQAAIEWGGFEFGSKKEIKEEQAKVPKKEQKQISKKVKVSEKSSKHIKKKEKK